MGLFSAMEKRRRRLLETGQQGKRKIWGSEKYSDERMGSGFQSSAPLDSFPLVTCAQGHVQDLALRE